MPSVSPKQHNLMAACLNGAAYKKCPPLSVAREFMRADRGSALLNRSAGGTSRPLESGMDSKLNFGMGHGNSFFSTTPLMGHAMSGSLPKRYAEGGEVKKPALSAKERSKIREMIERGKADAVDALRSTRAQLLNTPSDASSSLRSLSDRLARKTLAVDQDDPERMYEQYTSLMQELESDARPEAQMQLIERIANLEGRLRAMGIELDDG